MNLMTTGTTYYDMMVEDMLGFGSLRSLQPESIIRIGSILMQQHESSAFRKVLLSRTKLGRLVESAAALRQEQQVRICFGYTFLSTKIADGP